MMHRKKSPGAEELANRRIVNTTIVILAIIMVIILYVLHNSNIKRSVNEAIMLSYLVNKHMESPDFTADKLDIIRDNISIDADIIVGVSENYNIRVIAATAPEIPINSLFVLNLDEFTSLNEYQNLRESVNGRADILYQHDDYVIYTSVNNSIFRFGWIIGIFILLAVLLLTLLTSTVRNAFEHFSLLLDEVTGSIHKGEVPVIENSPKDIRLLVKALEGHNIHRDEEKQIEVNKAVLLRENINISKNVLNTFSTKLIDLLNRVLKQLNWIKSVTTSYDIHGPLDTSKTELDDIANNTKTLQRIFTFAEDETFEAVYKNLPAYDDLKVKIFDHQFFLDKSTHLARLKYCIYLMILDQSPDHYNIQVDQADDSLVVNIDILSSKEATFRIDLIKSLLENSIIKLEIEEIPNGFRVNLLINTNDI